MEDCFKTKLIVNPNSAAGRTGKNWPRIQEIVGKYVPGFDHEFTQGPLDATRIARKAIDDG